MGHKMHVAKVRPPLLQRHFIVVSLHYLSFSPPVGSDLDDSTTISSQLMPTCKVRVGDFSCHRIGSLPIGFVPPLLHRGNSIVFNLVFSFPSFSILQVDSFGQDTHIMLQNIIL
jgi:hypothetical protein